MVLARMKAHQKAQLARILAKGLQVTDDRFLKVGLSPLQHDQFYSQKVAYQSGNTVWLAVAAALLALLHNVSFPFVSPLAQSLFSMASTHCYG